MSKLADIMIRDVVSVSMDCTAEDVRTLFEEHHFHHVVVQRGGKLVGVISDRDLLKTISPFVGKLAERPQDVASLQRLAHQIMTRHLITAGAETTIEDAIALLLEHSISCLPVVDDRDRCIGIVTWRDLLRCAAEQAYPRTAAPEGGRDAA